jgi:hypothetical protein
MAPSWCCPSAARPLSCWQVRACARARRVLRSRQAGTPRPRVPKTFPSTAAAVTCIAWTQCVCPCLRGAEHTAQRSGLAGVLVVLPAGYPHTRLSAGDAASLLALERQLLQQEQQAAVVPVFFAADSPHLAQAVRVCSGLASLAAQRVRCGWVGAVLSVARVSLCAGGGHGGCSQPRRAAQPTCRPLARAHPRVRARVVSAARIHARPACPLVLVAGLLHESQTEQSRTFAV